MPCEPQKVTDGFWHIWTVFPDISSAGISQGKGSLKKDAQLDQYSNNDKGKPINTELECC